MKEDLIHKLSEFQARRMSLDDIELWLVSHAHNFVAEQDKDLQMYADKLDALFIQFGEGVVSLGELDEEIEGVLRSLTTVRDSSIQTFMDKFNEATAGNNSIVVHFRTPEVVQDLRLPVFVVG